MTENRDFLEWEARRLRRPIWWRSPWALVWLWASLLVLDLATITGMNAWMVIQNGYRVPQTQSLRLLTVLSFGFPALQIGWLAAMAWTVARAWERDLPEGKPGGLFVTPVTPRMMLAARTWVWRPHVILITALVGLLLGAMTICNAVVYATTIGLYSPILGAILIEALIQVCGVAGFFLAGLIALGLGTRLALRGLSPVSAALVVAVIEGILAMGGYGAYRLAIWAGLPWLLTWLAPLDLAVHVVLALWFARGLVDRVEDLQAPWA